MVGSISGSPCVGNPFDHPLPHTQSAQHTEIMSVGPGASVASISPLEVMFCSCCGSQNVVGRPSCWRCSTLFSAVVANNGADQNLLQGDRIGATSCPPPSLSPSESFRFRGAGAASASIANTAYPWLEAHLSLHQPGSWHQGGFWEELELVVMELRVLFLLMVIATLCKEEDQGFKVDTLYLLPKTQVKVK